MLPVNQWIWYYLCLPALLGVCEILPEGLFTPWELEEIRLMGGKWKLLHKEEQYVRGSSDPLHVYKGSAWK